MANWLITGTSTGLGRALAEAVLAEGDIVAGTVRSHEAKATFEALAPGRALGLLMEARDPASCAQAVIDAESMTGAIDVLVSNAGQGLVGALEETSYAELRDLFEINVFGAVTVMQAMLPFMRRRRAGHIINVTSVSGLSAWVGTAIYGATKHAMECIGETMANEVREFGIKVTNVAPGGLRTDFAGRSMAVTATRMPIYDGAARDADRAFAQHRGAEVGDPARIAAAIIKVVQAPVSPMHLLLGKDALHYAEEAIERLQADMADWRTLSQSTHFD